jgi:hypothetical protein
VIWIIRLFNELAFEELVDDTLHGLAGHSAPRRDFRHRSAAMPLYRIENREFCTGVQIVTLCAARGPFHAPDHHHEVRCEISYLKGIFPFQIKLHKSGCIMSGLASPWRCKKELREGCSPLICNRTRQMVGIRVFVDT